MDCSDSADILPCTCYDRLAFVMVTGAVALDS